MNKAKELVSSINFEDLIFIGLVLLIVSSILGFMCVTIRDRRTRTSGRNGRKKKQGIFMIKSYKIFSKFSLTRSYVDQMRRCYEYRFPCDIRTLMLHTMRTCYVIWMLGVVAIVAIFGLKPSFYTAYLSILTVVVVNKEVLLLVINEMDRNIREKFSEYLTDVRHGFYNHGMIDRAMADAAEHCGRKKGGRIMKLNALKMIEVIGGSDKTESIRRYNKTVSNKYLRMFLSFAVYVADYGDNVVNNVSVLLYNINTLKTDIYIEIMNVKDNEHGFSGLIFIVLAPVYMLEIISNWTVKISSSTAGYYNSPLGLSVMIVIAVSTIVIYTMINELKGSNAIVKSEHAFIKFIYRSGFIRRSLKNYEQKNKRMFYRTEEILYRVYEGLSPQQFLLKRILYGIVLFVICIIFALSAHHDNRFKLMNSPIFVNNIAGVVSEKYVAPAGEYVVSFVFEHGKDELSREAVEAKVRHDNVFRSEMIQSAIVDEIMLRYKKSQTEYFHWYELLFAVAVAGIGFYTPYLMLLYRKKVLSMNMAIEVAQFQSQIMMVMHLNNTTVLKTLELMETFAIIFKESLKKCISEYSAGDIDALEKLRLREQYAPFVMLVDNLIAADKIGVQSAFDEIVDERKISQEMRNRDYKIARDKKVSLGMFLAFVPAVITVTFYWIVPFAVNVLGGLLQYDQVMNSLH